MFVIKVLNYECFNQIMEQRKRKKIKTKKLIAIKTNNFIQTQNQKQQFFEQLIQQIKRSLEPQQQQFLLTCLLSQQTNHQKKLKNQVKIGTHKRIISQPQQRPFNLADIDINLFNINTEQKNKIIVRSPIIKTSENDQKCSGTPPKKMRQIQFKNKKTLDLNIRLQQKYAKNNKQNPIKTCNSLLNRNHAYHQNQPLIKYKYISSLRYNNIKSTRLNTQIEQSLDDKFLKRQSFRQDKGKEVQNITYRNNYKGKMINSNTFRKSEMLNCESLKNRRFFVPDEFMNLAIKTSKIKLKTQCNQFSDIKLTARYKQCFS